MITLTSFDGEEFDAYLALPASGFGPGIVVMQEIFGVNHFVRGVADWYAAHGFVAIAPDLFWRQERGVIVADDDFNRALQLYIGLDEAKAVDDTAAAMEFLRKHPSCNGRVGGVGFCLGGKLAYLLSARYKPDCAVGYYGVRIENALDDATNISNPLLLHFGGKDDFCSSDAQTAIRLAVESNPLVTIHTYPDRGHAFARPGGDHFDERDAELANLRTLEFFVSHLAGEGISSAHLTLSTKWDDHVKYEFATRNTEDTLDTMVADAYVNHVPVMTGGVGHEELREFYSKRFIPQMPPDTAMTPVSRTVGVDRIVD